jgi:biotin transport system ATP-binding protein/energy-coupling factor transport system ATP-binding protein
VGIAGLASRNIENLSGGEKRLVAIAGVLAMQPRYIAFDEPTAFLDPAASSRILKIIDKLYGENISIIHITHNMNEAAMASPNCGAQRRPHLPRWNSAGNFQQG